MVSVFWRFNLLIECQLMLNLVLSFALSCVLLQVIAKFLALLYTYLNLSISQNIVPDEIKGREIHHSFPMTLFQVRLYSVSVCCSSNLVYWMLVPYHCLLITCTCFVSTEY